MRYVNGYAFVIVNMRHGAVNIIIFTFDVMGLTAVQETVWLDTCKIGIVFVFVVDLFDIVNAMQLSLLLGFIISSDRSSCSRPKLLAPFLFLLLVLLFSQVPPALLSVRALPMRQQGLSAQSLVPSRAISMAVICSLFDGSLTWFCVLRNLSWTYLTISFQSDGAGQRCVHLD